jgi:hypothetical protein
MYNTCIKNPYIFLFFLLQEQIFIEDIKELNQKV